MNTNLNSVSNFSFKDIVSIAATGFPTKAIEKVTGTGTNANKIVSLAVTGNPNLISNKPSTPAPNTLKAEPTNLQTDKSAINNSQTTPVPPEKIKSYLIFGIAGLVVLAILIYFFKK